MEIKQVKITDEGYPALLKLITRPPQVLYYIGTLPMDGELCLGIVGARRCTQSGASIAKDIADKISERNITIVSGLALGIDTVAHEACVQKDRRTIAVLGTGLDERSIYPRSNLLLSKKIIATKGCLISELPPGSFGSRFSFPNRNRIISALSIGVVAIEAKVKSGSSITANYASSQGKKVFVTQNPDVTYFVKRGAKIVDNAEDILQELDIH